MNTKRGSKPAAKPKPAVRAKSVAKAKPTKPASRPARGPDPQPQPTPPPDPIQPTSARRRRSTTEVGVMPPSLAQPAVPGWNVAPDPLEQPTTVAEVRALREAGRHDEHRSAAAWVARRAPQDVYAQIEAAYASDRADDEHGAIRHYDAAYRLGVPESERRQFLVGYGSTLRNVGRAEEAIVLLAQAVADDPHYPPFAAFLALALMSAGQPRAALATMLGCALEAARPDAFGRLTRALGEYQRELLAPPVA